MSRRDEQLRKERDIAISTTVSSIYLASITEVLHEAGLKQNDIEYLLNCVTEKAEMLTKGYIGLADYISSVEEKTGIKLRTEE